MKTAGIIAEYNPFHTGHQYHIEQTRQVTGAEYIIVVMSGDFVQRGAPALLSKFTRAEMALLGGADLVLELPASCSCQSAEYFAHHGVSLLHALGCVDYLSFGSECGDISQLQSAVAFLQNESAEYKEHLKTLLKSGHSFPAARAKAVAAFCSENIHLQAVLDSPNNILGIEYLKALKRLQSTMTPVTVTRKGSSYHCETLPESGYPVDTDSQIPDTLPSASALRKAILKNDHDHSSIEQIRSCFPVSVREKYKNTLSSMEFLTEEDFSILLHWTLYQTEDQQLLRFQDVDSFLCNRIRKTRDSYASFSQYAALLKTKDITYTRICRALFHILLQIENPSRISYARILGFRRSAAPLLTQIRKNTSIPLISKLADASSFLGKDAYAVLEQNIRISHLYEAVCSEKYHRPFQNEYRKQIVIME